MRTPISNCLFFISVIMKIFSSLCEHSIVSEQVSSARRYLTLTESQLQLTLSFVNDLLDLRCIKEGVFTLVTELFDPSEIF